MLPTYHPPLKLVEGIENTFLETRFKSPLRFLGVSKKVLPCLLACLGGWPNHEVQKNNGRSWENTETNLCGENDNSSACAGFRRLHSLSPAGLSAAMSAIDQARPIAVARSH